MEGLSRLTSSRKEVAVPVSNKISVVIVTHNRNKDCREVVNSVLMQKEPPYEIIVIDDASSDPFQLKNSKVKIIRNISELGLAASRNIGIQMSTGNIVAFIDDDALAPPDWVEKLQKAFTDDVDIIGGVCKPLYLSPIPNWWNENLYGLLVGINYDGIIGCNLAANRRVFDKVGYFNERLGRRYGKLISHEETEFLQRVKKISGKIIFKKELVVYHKIYPNRLTMHYLLRRVWYDSVSECIMYPVSEYPRKLLGCIKRTAVYIVKMVIDYKKFRYYLIKLVAQVGFIYGCIKFSKLK